MKQQQQKSLWITKLLVFKCYIIYIVRVWVLFFSFHFFFFGFVDLSNVCVQRDVLHLLCSALAPSLHPVGRFYTRFLWPLQIKYIFNWKCLSVCSAYAVHWVAKNKTGHKRLYWEDSKSSISSQKSRKFHIIDYAWKWNWYVFRA